MVERVSARDVVHQKCSCSTSVITSSDRTERFLAGCVPDLYNKNKNKKISFCSMAPSHLKFIRKNLFNNNNNNNLVRVESGNINEVGLWRLQG